jgi:hypothetical protein
VGLEADHDLITIDKFMAHGCHVPLLAELSSSSLFQLIAPSG